MAQYKSESKCISPALLFIYQTVANNMKKRTSTYIFVILIMSFLSCKSQENKQSELINTPKSFKIIDETDGDLDKDGISEKVVVYDTDKETDLGTERQIFI